MTTNQGKNQDQQSDQDKQSSQGSSRGGTHEQHVEAGRQSHKNDPAGSKQSGGKGSKNMPEDSDDQDVGGRQSGSGASRSGSSGGTRGGTPEQHAEAGRQSHKNDDK
ncbi:MAG: hypothetical protein V4805_13460 [Pseudomonadota bacterium]